jgi:hypothetical protein
MKQPEERKETHSVLERKVPVMKKVMSLAIALMTVLCLMIPMFASAATVSEMTDTMYVNCANGGSLNVRSAPIVDKSTFLYSVECGTKVTVDFTVAAPQGWAFVNVANHKKGGFVKIEFLVAKKPGKYEITQRARDFHTVNPYLVAAKPLKGHETMSVGLRVSPNKTAKMIRRLNTGDRLQVIERGSVWSKVIDLTTGRTGYMANDYMEIL